MKAFFVLVAAVLAPVLSWSQDYTDSVLTNLHGVGLEVRPLNIQSEQFDLDFDDVESHALDTLADYGVRVLSPVELDVVPGQPYLEVTIDVAHAQGPSHLYVVKLELRELARLDRAKDRVVTMSLPTWERKMMGVANRPEAIKEVMDRLLRIFSDEYHSMNREEAE